MKAKWTAEQFLSTLRRGVMPVTVGFVQQRTGMAEHEARRVRNELVRRGALVPVSKYKGRKHGFWVTLYRVVQPAASVTSSVRKKRRVKRRDERKQWWLHQLFGNPGGEPPENRRRRKRMTQEEKPSRPRDPLWDALEEHFGPMRTPRDRSRRSAAVKELREAEATVDEIRIAYEWCRDSFTIFTELALCSHFGRAQFEAAKKARPVASPLALVRKMADGD